MCVCYCSFRLEADSRYELISEENNRWREFIPYVRDVLVVKYLNWHFALSEYLV